MFLSNSHYIETPFSSAIYYVSFMAFLLTLVLTLFMILLLKCSALAVTMPGVTSISSGRKYYFLAASL